MSKFITANDVLVICSTSPISIDQNRITDQHIELAQDSLLAWLGEDMYEAMEADANDIGVWAKNADYSEDDLVSHKYLDKGRPVSNIFQAVTDVTGVTVQPQSSSDWTLTGDFFQTAAYNNLWANGGKEFMAWATWMQALPDIQDQTRNAGVVQNNPAGSTNTGSIGIQRASARAYNNLYKWALKAHDYIQENKASYPDYRARLPLAKASGVHLNYSYADREFKYVPWKFRRY